MNLKTLGGDTRLQVGFTLFLVWLLDTWHFRGDAHLAQIIVYPLFSIALISALDVGLTWIRYRRIYLPMAPIVSGFLIGLILAPTEPFYVIAIASVLASFSKQFIAGGIRQHIFNPAAFGIMGVYVLFGTTVSWWGITWSKLPLIILIPLMIRILWRLHRLFLPIGFLFVYALYFIVSQSPLLALQTLVDPTVLFFALVMLPEPITSPATGYFKYAFGAAVAIVAILIGYFTKLSEIFLPALLVANMLGFWLIKLRKTSKNSSGAD